jgi:hypothetical protein
VTEQILQPLNATTITFWVSPDTTRHIIHSAGIICLAIFHLIFLPRRLFMKTRIIRYIATCVFLLLLPAPWLSAQTNTTALSGTVVDASGAMLPGATINISNTASGTTKSTMAKSKGEFSFEQLPPGTYEVKVTSPGFSEQDEKVELLVSTPVNLTFKLTAGSVEVVNVETSIAEINSTDATLGSREYWVSIVVPSPAV